MLLLAVVFPLSVLSLPPGRMIVVFFCVGFKRRIKSKTKLLIRTVGNTC